MRDVPHVGRSRARWRSSSQDGADSAQLAQLQLDHPLIYIPHVSVGLRFRV